MIGIPKVFRQSGYTFAIERESSFYHNKKIKSVGGKARER